MKTLVAAILLSGVASSPAVGAEFCADVQYANVDGESLRLDVSVPDGAGPFPVAILVHGGGWGGGDKAREHVPPTAELTSGGFVWFSINYRLAPAHRWPACVDDVRTAIRWVKTHAAQYQGDPARIALIGYSAGGHLAAFASATAEADTRVGAVVLFAAPTDLVADCERRGQVSPALQALLDRGPTIDEEAQSILQAASPIVHVSADSPPHLLIHGTADESVPYSQSVNYRSRLDALGVPCELITIPAAPHRLDRWDSIDESYDHKMQQMVDWLKATLREPD